MIVLHQEKTNKKGELLKRINSPSCGFPIMGKLNNFIVKGEWTPKIYDYETAKGTFPTNSGTYFDIGGVFRVFVFNYQATSAFTFNTMLQIRGDAINGYSIFGGNLYAAGATNSLGGKTIQAVSGAVYIRPNYTGTIAAGWWSGYFIGIKTDWL